MTLRKIISGGQTGVDQAALQAAIDSGLDHGGWCPPGRMCETGKIPDHFLLEETPLERDPSAPEIPRSQRTIRNVRDSDASLIFWIGEVQELQSDKGTKLALETSKKMRKPYLIANPETTNVETIQKWIEENDIEVLSVGGPSEGSSPGIYRHVYQILRQIF